MDKLIGFTIFSIVFVTLLANPAPQSIEFLDLVLIALPCFLGYLSLLAMKSCHVELPEINLIIAIMIYLSYLLISILMGLMHGAPMLNILRSLGPYINFFPLIFLGILPKRLVNPWVIAAALIAVGGLQGIYQIYLYSTHIYAGSNTLDVLRNRITLMEPRSTLPIVFSVTILPIVLLLSPNKIVKVLAACLMVLGLFAGAATLTRSIIISMIIGWLTFIMLYLHYQLRIAPHSLKKLIKHFCLYMTAICVAILLISLIPKIHSLEQGLLSRFLYHPSSTTIDYSNGRIYDEWIPALTAWTNSDMLGLLFGIGAGTTFTVATGEERTYIHNLVIYSLVYGGIYGLLSCLWLYFTIFKTLIFRASQANQIIYLGFAALLASIFAYAQLFAVHKGLAFNAMLFLMIALALSQPVNRKVKQMDDGIF